MKSWEIHPNTGALLAIVTTGWLPSSPTAGIDGPAAFLGSEAADPGTKIQILSSSQPQLQLQSQSQSPAAEEPERDGDTETLLQPKTDIHELLQKQGEFGGAFDCELECTIQLVVCIRHITYLPSLLTLLELIDAISEKGHERFDCVLLP